MGTNELMNQGQVFLFEELTQYHLRIVKGRQKKSFEPNSSQCVYNSAMIFAFSYYLLFGDGLSHDYHPDKQLFEMTK